MGRVKLVLLTLGAGLGLVLLLEGALALCGIGGFDAAVDSRLKYQQIFPPTFRPARLADGREVLATADPRLPFQWIEREPPARHLRVLVFGESAVAGLGFSPNVTIVRELERLLAAACPERALEIVNLGIVALPSKQVRKLVEEACAQYRPDALVIYCGNNEFLELHAEKFADAIATPAQKLLRSLARSHLYGALRGLGQRSESVPGVTTADVAGNDQRVSEARMIEKVEVSGAERELALQRFGENLAGMLRAAAEAHVPVALCCVAVNWEWIGREDPPADWIEAWIGGQAGDAGLAHARAMLEAELERCAPKQRYELLWKLGQVARRQRDFAAAARWLAQSAEEDPHLRRCLPSMNARVLALGAAPGVSLVDVPARLAARAPDGIVGYADFYDYVHFTPRGAALTALEVYTALRGLRVFEPRADFDAQAHTAARLAAFAALERDPLAVGDFLGIGFDRARLSDRDLWKYETLARELDQRIAADARDFDALVYRGNRRFFERDGLAGARADYTAALAVRDEPVLRENLARLEGARRP